MNNTKTKTTRIVITWPTTQTFTIKGDILPLNPGQKEITIRNHLQKEIESGRIAEIGSIAGSQGRPRKVFAHTPVTENVLSKASADGVTLVDQSRLQKLQSPVVMVPNSVPVIA